MCLYKHKSHFLTPDDIRTLREFIQEQRGSLQGYDIATSHQKRSIIYQLTLMPVAAAPELSITSILIPVF